MKFPTRSRFALTATTLLLLFTGLTAQSQVEADLFHAYYLEHEAQRPEAALALYLQVAEDRNASEDLRAEALERASGLLEDLAATDFARLVPSNALLFAEFSRPGEQLMSMLDQLGLLARAHHEGPERLGISPHLVQGLMGMRGAAVAITGFNPMKSEPLGVLILHPGELDVIRGLIETGLPAGGQPVDSIGGHPTWKIEGRVLVTLTARLVVVSTDRRQIEGVVERLAGETADSLAENSELKEALAGRGDGLVSFCINPKPVMPLVKIGLAQAAKDDPEVAAMLAVLDVESLHSISGHMGVDDTGLGVDLALRLDEGHRNLAFNLLRMPHVDTGTLELVPGDAALFMASTFNSQAPVAELARDTEGQPIVSLMDFGREIFGNLVDMALFAVPGPAETHDRGPIPDLAAVVRVNDPSRSRALWEFALNLGSLAGPSAGSGATPDQIGAVEVDIYDCGGVPVYFGVAGNRIIVSPSRHAFQRALEAGERGRSVLADPLYASCLEHIDPASTFVLMMNPGRCVGVAASMAPGGLPAEAAMLGDLLRGTVLSVDVAHSSTHYALQLRANNLPDLGQAATHFLRQQQQQQQQHQHQAPVVVGETR